MLGEKGRNLANERQITRLKSQHLLPTVKKISRAPLAQQSSTEVSTVLETTSNLEMSSPRDRLKTLKQHRLCTRACLSQGHNAKKCSRQLACARPGCGNDHHYLIHSSEADGNGIGIDTNGCDTF